MAYERFGRDAAGTWRDAAMSPVSRWITLGVGIAGIIAGTITSPESACTPLDPCTPLTVDAFGVLLGLLGLSFLGLWLWPTAGAALGIAAGIVDVAYDPAVAGRIVFAAYAVACLNLLFGLRRARAAQRAVLDEVAREPVVSSQGPVMASGKELWSVWIWVGATTAAVVAAVAFGSFVGAKASDAEHRAKAVKATGTVASGWDDELLQRVTIEQGGLPEQLRISASSELPTGTHVQLLVDPTDPTWTEIPGDPLDHSAWLALGILATGLAFGALALLGLRRWAASRHVHEGIGLEVAVSLSGEVALRPAGGGRVFASFLTGSPSPVRTTGSRRRRLDWMPAVAVGDLHDAGWVTVFTRIGVVTPGTPLRAVREDHGELGLGALPGLASARRRWRAVADRLPPGRAVWAVLVGVGLLAGGAASLPDAIVVAQGGGVPGTLTITSENCSKSCSYSGEFRSTNGSYVFKDVFYAGSGEIGSTWPAVYVGSGEVPEEVYEPGNSALRFSGFFTLVGLGTAAYPFVRRFLDGPRRSRRRP